MLADFSWGFDPLLGCRLVAQGAEGGKEAQRGTEGGSEGKSQGKSQGSGISGLVDWTILTFKEPGLMIWAVPSHKKKIPFGKDNFPVD